MTLIHGTCVSIAGVGVLFRGPSGSGKSDLALRLLNRKELDVFLVADDQVCLTRREDGLWAIAPNETANMIEVRGVGLVTVDNVVEVRLRLILEVCGLECIPRMPRKSCFTIDGITLPLYPCAFLEVSAPDKVLLLAQSMDGDIFRS